MKNLTKKDYLPEHSGTGEPYKAPYGGGSLAESPLTAYA